MRSVDRVTVAVGAETLMIFVASGINRAVLTLLAVTTTVLTPAPFATVAERVTAGAVTTTVLTPAPFATVAERVTAGAEIVIEFAPADNDAEVLDGVLSCQRWYHV